MTFLFLYQLNKQIMQSVAEISNHNGVMNK